ncbi:MAG: hypothetical protein PHQ40_09850 [Anaerolineaceae bacterium]|nr:hypothetical protein [Anaerolineaceae bacterium]
MRKIPILIFALLTAWIYAILATASLLGFLRIYRVWLAIPLVLLITLAILWLYRREGVIAYYHTFWKDSGQPPVADSHHAGIRMLDLAFSLAGAAITIFLILLPVMRWPYSPVSETLHWDAGLYHLPKALELVKTGSSWDMTIAYGEYPSGYEDLFSFAAVITRNGSLFGIAHALTCLYLLFAFWMLLRRYTSLSTGVALFASSFVMMSGFFTQIDSNLWWIIKYLVYTIGKNDLFLGAALLAAVLHAPIGPGHNQKEYSVTGLAVTSMIAISIKPNALPVIAGLWVWMGLSCWRQRHKSLRFTAFPWKQMVGTILLILPGGLWAVRNVLAQGAVISAGAMGIQEGSISNNLLNPFFYQNISQDLVRVTLILIISTVLAIFRRQVHWSMVVAYALLLAGFAITPATAYFGNTQVRPEIAWRFAVAALVAGFILTVTWFSPWLNGAYRWIGRRVALSGLAAILVLTFTGWFVWEHRSVLEYRVKNEIVLEDQFRDPVGTGGYHSAYDYIHQNVRDSVVWVENGLPFYAFGPGITNSVTRSRNADYLVIFQTAWNGGSAQYPSNLDDPLWQKNWTLVYEDSQGRVYHRIE